MYNSMIINGDDNNKRVPKHDQYPDALSLQAVPGSPKLYSGALFSLVILFMKKEYPVGKHFSLK